VISPKTEYSQSTLFFVKATSIYWYVRVCKRW
jgi:hypothetical protein